jgi:membrane fusion protein (multidrug efflux system)
MSKRTIVIPLVILVVAAFLLFAINGQWTSWEGGRSEQKTDDAYVRADLVPLSTRISGTVRKMDVQDFQPVKAGQPLVELDDDDYRATVDQAKAGLAAAQAALEDNQASKRIQEAKIDSAEASPDLECHAQGFLDGSYIRGGRGELTITTLLSLALKKECE